MHQSIDLVIPFKAGQILYIEHQGARLYGEVIQVVADRGLCWVRPLALVTPPIDCNLDYNNPDYGNYNLVPDSVQCPSESSGYGSPLLSDLRQGADLVCPQALFQMALDTEVIPILAQLDRLKPESIAASEFGENRLAHEQIREFIRHVWQTNPQVFN